jgi:hypothetical protein
VAGDQCIETRLIQSRSSYWGMILADGGVSQFHDIEAYRSAAAHRKNE